MAADRNPLQAVVLYTADPWDSALPVLRVRGPAEVMGIQVIRGNEGDRVAPERVSQGDLVIVQRDFPRFEGAWEAVTVRAWAENKPVIYELDDLLLDLPAGHVMEQAYAEALFPILRAVVEADALVASTAPLGAYLAPFNAQVCVQPNSWDDRLWPGPERPAQPAATGPLIIGYMGGETHRPDLEAITPSLLAVLERFGARIRFQFWGGRPPEALLARPNVNWTPLDLLNYADFASYFAAQVSDIFIAPLQDNPFNRCKSNIKYLEYSALGVAGIYSRLDPYDSIVTSGENGLLAATAQDWETGLGQLIESDAIRQALAARAQATVQQNWRLSQRAPDWLAVYQKLADAGHQASRRTPHQQVLARVASQAQGRQLEREAQLRAMAQQITAQTLEVGRLTDELHEIHISPEWRLTVQLRGLRARLAPPGSWRDKLLDRLVLSRLSARTRNPEPPRDRRG